MFACYDSSCVKFLFQEQNDPMPSLEIVPIIDNRTTANLRFYLFSCTVALV